MRPVVWVLALSACGRLGFDGVDDAAPDVPADGCALGAWSTPTLIAALDSSGSDLAASLSTDALSMVFASDRAGGAGDLDLYMTTRPDLTTAFGPPQPLTQLNTTGPDQGPSFSFDGLTLYYASALRLHTATRPSVDAVFTAPTIVPELSAVTVIGLELTAAGDELFFARGGGIRRATYTGGVFTETGPVTELNVGSTCCPTFTHDGLTIYFTSDRGGDFDIYSSTRPAIGAPFGLATPIGIINSPSTDDDPDLSDDGRTLVFNSNRGTSHALYVSTRSCD